MVTLRVDVLIARLRDLGIATPNQLEHAKQDLATSQERFSEILVRQGVLRDAEAGKRLAVQLGSMPQRITSSPVASQIANHIPGTMWRDHRLVPIQELEGRLIVATDDPLSVFALDLFGRRCGCSIEAVLVREQEFSSLLNAMGNATVAPPHESTAMGRGAGREDRGRGHEGSPSSSAASVAPPRDQATTLANPVTPSGDPGRTAGGTAAGPATTRGTPSIPLAPAPVRPSATPAPPSRVGSTPSPDARRTPSASASKGAPGAVTDASDEPIIQLVDSILSEAVRMRASDIHIQPEHEQIRVRYRIDGVLHDVSTSPKALQGPIVSRMKIMAGLNIAEKRLPQDGRLQITVEARPLDVRVSVLPAMHGESIVMRILDRSQSIRGLPEMGLSPDNQALWHELIHRPHGMVLVTGPTGSGKTTTLYGALIVLNQPDRKLITVEDPVEYQLTGVNQVLVRASVGLTFAAGLRAMLRQAPDVILVGEIRDAETAQIAIQAALTGHLVLSTLHTNDAPSSVTRLIDMGIAPFLVASTVQGILAQRLVRRICPDCRITDNATPEEQAFLGEPEVTQVVRSNGCDKCHGSGFFGRIGLFELLTISESVRQLIVNKASASAIRLAAVREGMRGLREDGCLKIREGLTTMAEVLRVVADVE